MYLLLFIYIMNNIIQMNCRGLCANVTDSKLLCDKYNPIVCCLQETMLAKYNFVIRGFNCINLISRGIPYSECSLNTPLQAKTVTISTSKTITIC